METRLSQQPIAVFRSMYTVQGAVFDSYLHTVQYVHFTVFNNLHVQYQYVSNPTHIGVYEYSILYI